MVSGCGQGHNCAMLAVFRNVDWHPASRSFVAKILPETGMSFRIHSVVFDERACLRTDATQYSCHMRHQIFERKDWVEIGVYDKSNKAEIGSVLFGSLFLFLCALMLVFLVLGAPYCAYEIEQGGKAWTATKKVNRGAPWQGTQGQNHLSLSPQFSFSSTAKRILETYIAFKKRLLLSKVAF